MPSSSWIRHECFLIRLAAVCMVNKYGSRWHPIGASYSYGSYTVILKAGLNIVAKQKRSNSFQNRALLHIIYASTSVIVLGAMFCV